MNKNQKSVLFLSCMGVMCLVMFVIYVNFLHDKPLIDAQNKQSIQQQNLTPDQMVNGIKSFITTTTSVIKTPPVP